MMPFVEFRRKKERFFHFESFVLYILAKMHRINMKQTQIYLLVDIFTGDFLMDGWLLAMDVAVIVFSKNTKQKKFFATH